MGACKFCGKEAGWFKDEHPTCRDLNTAGWQDMVHQASEAALGKADVSNLRDRLRQLGDTTHQSEDAVPNAVVAGWEEAANTAMQDKLLSHEEEAALMTYAGTFSLQQSDLDTNRCYTRIGMSAVLREILNGGLPPRIQADVVIPFNFLKDEVLVWLFQNVPYHEMHTARAFEGASAGVSIRVAKGLYFRTSSFRGHPAEHTQLQQADTGLFGVTDKHLYFSGATKSFRIPYKKIVAFTPYSDAIGIVRDAASAKPQAFTTGEGWFAYNLIVNLAHR